jgi:hypothetical protein
MTKNGESRATARRGTITLATAAEFIQAGPKQRPSAAGPPQQRRGSVAGPGSRKLRRGSFAITLDNEAQITDAIILVIYLCSHSLFW